MEFLTAIQAMAKFAMYRVLYTVTDGKCYDDALLATKKHRYLMAQLAVRTYEPLISFCDFGDLGDGPIERAIMSDGRERLRIDAEDYTFRLFKLNPYQPIILVFMSEYEHCRRVDDFGRDDTINKLSANIKQKFSGFNPLMHSVIGLFIGDQGQARPNVKLKPEEQAFRDENFFYPNILRIDLLERQAIEGMPTNPKDVSHALKEAFKGHRPENLALLSPSVYQYIQEHSDYKE